MLDREQTVERAADVRHVPGKSQELSGVLRLALFCLFLAALAYAFDWAVNHGLRNSRTSKFGVFNALVDGRINSQILINGSSRALCHYDSRIIQNVTGKSTFNIGMNASQIDLQLAMLKTYLKHNQRPEYLIQNLDAFSFETTERGKLYDPGYFMPYLRENEIYNFVRGVQPDAWKWKHVPLYGYSVEDMRFTWVWGVLGCFGFQGRESYFQGFNPRYGTWTGDFEQFSAGNAAGVTYRLEPQGIAALEEIIQICQSNSIKVVLVFSPEYDEMQLLEKNRAEVFGKFREIAQRYKVQFWDWSDKPISRSKEAFNNSQHLNATGAEWFSQDLAKRLQTAALIQP